MPTTNPSWTESVSQETAEAESVHSVWSAGETAEAENQSDMARSSASAILKSAPQRAGVSTAAASLIRRELDTSCFSVTC